MRPYQRRAAVRHERERDVREAAHRRSVALAELQRAEVELGEAIRRAYLADITAQEVDELTGLGRNLIVDLVRQRVREGSDPPVTQNAQDRL